MQSKPEIILRLCYASRPLQNSIYSSIYLTWGQMRSPDPVDAEKPCWQWQLHRWFCGSFIVDPNMHSKCSTKGPNEILSSYTIDSFYFFNVLVLTQAHQFFLIINLAKNSDILSHVLKKTFSPQYSLTFPLQNLKSLVLTLTRNLQPAPFALPYEIDINDGLLICDSFIRDFDLFTPWPLKV